MSKRLGIGHNPDPTYPRPPAPPGPPPLAGRPPAQVFGVIDPDYARVLTMARCLAWQYGYSCAAQGSFTRDLDLLLVPWTEQAWAERLPQIVTLLAEAAGLRVLGEPTAKPHGRLAWTLVFPGFGDPRFVDVSGFPGPPLKKP